MSSPITHSTEMREIKAMGEVNDPTQRKTKPVNIQRQPESLVPVDSLGMSDYQSDEDDTGKNGESLWIEPSPKRNSITSKPTQSNDPSDLLRRLEKENTAIRQELKDSIREQTELKLDLKDSHRETRDQSLELRDLKKQNAQLQESKRQNTQLQAQLQEALRHRAQFTDNKREQMRKERDDMIHHIQQQEDIINRLKHDLFNRKSHMESLTLQTREAVEKKEIVEDGNRKLTKLNRELSENLTECKDDLLRLQPPSQISDSGVSDQYSVLHQQISRWVDDETEESQPLEQRFESLPMSGDGLPELLRKYLDIDDLRLAKKHPYTQPLVLRHLINSFLQDHILREDIDLFGLNPSTVALIKGIEQGMKLLEPKRDAVTIRNWRSETLKAIFRTDEFRDEQRSQAIHHCQSLYSTLAYLLPDLEAQPEGWQALFEQIFIPALQVSNSIHLSTVDYRILSRLPKPPDKTKTMFIHELQRCEMMDMTSHKMIRSENILKIGEDGRIGEQMLCVQPALWRTQRDNAGSMILCKPIILVKLDEPMARRNRGIKAFTSWLGGDYVE